MKQRLSTLLVVALFAGNAGAEDLMQVYREAQLNDPALAAARANWTATQERVPLARAELLPKVSADASAYLSDGRTDFSGGVPVTANSYSNAGLTIQASQPLYNKQRTVAYDQAKRVVEQADFTLALTQQELILRVAEAYFAVLLAEVNIELAEAQKAAVSEQLAQAKRNFEVGVATITDTNEAQARYDTIVAQEIQSRNELDNRRTALRAIIGRMPGPLKKLGAAFEPELPNPNVLDAWVERALAENVNVRIAGYNLDLATLEIERARAGHLPTVSVVANAGLGWGSGSLANEFNYNSRNAQLGLLFNVPLYQGGSVESRVREALALQESTRQGLESARRSAIFNAQTGFTGVNSAAASVTAFKQALRSAETALASNKLGQEVGVRTNLDVLNVTQNVFQTRRDLADAYFKYLVAVLRLKFAAGTLSELDLEDINRRLGG
jgi:outer membrane protein